MWKKIIPFSDMRYYETLLNSPPMISDSLRLSFVGVNSLCGSSSDSHVFVFDFSFYSDLQKAKCFAAVLMHKA